VNEEGLCHGRMIIRMVKCSYKMYSLYSSPVNAARPGTHSYDNPPLARRSAASSVRRRLLVSGPATSLTRYIIGFQKRALE
jgi:hypothetical protein